MGKLKQASPVKYYMANFFFLGLGLLQWAAAAVLFFQFEQTPKNRAAIALFISLGAIMLVAFAYIFSTLKRVAIGKNKIVVFSKTKKEKFAWSDVKSIRLVPFFNLYRLRLKKRKGIIYFFPSKNIEPAYDLLAVDTSKMGTIVSKMKREFGI
ncbi:MAG: hypothetical protein KF845_04610 [Cyclobacteriaceae bacterium]|nr:hypothetical protein [Cyclobacteriaceae bacterium]